MLKVKALLHGASVIAALAVSSGCTLADLARAEPLLRMVDKQLSAKCAAGTDGKVVDPPISDHIAHQYLLLLIFQKGQGSEYFGYATSDQNGCIPDVEKKLDPVAKRSTLAAKGTQLAVSTCPNDCTYPRGARLPTNEGKDPLGPSNWGILSAVNTEMLSGGPRRHVEIWEIAVKDACHARELYALHMAKEGRLRKAYDAKHMLGEILVGYALPGRRPGSTTPCS